MMNAINDNDGGKPWCIATTLDFPKVTLYMLVTTQNGVASGSSVTNIVHYATERAQAAAEVPEGASLNGATQRSDVIQYPPDSTNSGNTPALECSTVSQSCHKS